MIKPDGWAMPTGKFWVDNAFSQKRSEAEGVPVREVLDSFLADYDQCQVLAAHNMNYDDSIVWKILPLGTTEQLLSGQDQFSAELCKAFYEDWLEEEELEFEEVKRCR